MGIAKHILHTLLLGLAQRIDKLERSTHGPKHVVTSVSAVARGGYLHPLPQAPGEKQAINFKSKMALDSRLSSLPGASCDAAADELFPVMQRAYTEDPSHKFV